MVASLGRPEKGSSSNDRGRSSCCATSGPAQCLLKKVHRILNIIRCNPCLYEDLCALMTCWAEVFRDHLNERFTHRFDTSKRDVPQGK